MTTSMEVTGGVASHILTLAIRSFSKTGLPGGKTAAEYAVEGRYNYVPSLAAAIVFAVLFGICAVINWWQFFRHRAWFWWMMNAAILMELVGYIARVRSIKKLDDKSLFIVQTVLILVAPAVMAASCYSAFGRVTMWVVPQRFQTWKTLWVPPRRITLVFVGFDVFSFFIQVVGGAMVAAASTRSKAETGKNIVLVGLGLQLATFGFFVFATVRLNWMLRTKMRDVALPKERNWQLFLNVINVVNMLILIRTLLRLVEYAMGTSNYLTNHEWFFYCFDSALMFLAVAIFLVFHPGYYLPYLGIRRKTQQFSKNADKGPLGRLAKGRQMTTIDME